MKLDRICLFFIQFFGLFINNIFHWTISLAVPAAPSQTLQTFVPLINLNMSANHNIIKGDITVRTLNWGEDITEFLPAPDFLLLADCIYYAAVSKQCWYLLCKSSFFSFLMVLCFQSLEPLVKTIRELSCPATCVLCCFEERTTGNKPELQQKFFEVWETFLTN